MWLVAEFKGIATIWETIIKNYYQIWILLSKTIIKFESCKISLIHNIAVMCSKAALLCAKFQNDMTTQGYPAKRALSAMRKHGG